MLLLQPVVIAGTARLDAEPSSQRLRMALEGQMKLSDLSLSSLDLVQGLEKSLRQRRRGAAWSLGLAGAGFALQFLLALTDKDYTAKLGKLGTLAKSMASFDFYLLIRADTYTPEVVGAIIVVVGVLGFFLLRWTSLLMRESDECFRYSFQVAGFNKIEGTPDNRCKLQNEHRLKLLSVDLTERLNGRIRRLSLLSVEKADEKTIENQSLAAHIYIDGSYAVRETGNETWAIQVIANVRIGGKDRPSTQAAPVRLQLEPTKASPGTPTEPSPPAIELVMEAEDYKQLVERVYSRVATEVYRQIESDIHSKIKLFPTAYLRAVALSREAEDFLRSNTIDAYDRALELYRQSLRHFNVADVKEITAFLARLPIFWRKESQFIRRRSAVVTGYAKCAIFRRKLSTLTGRTRNSLFDVPALLEEAVAQLETLHRHVTFDPLGEYTNADRTFVFLTFPRDTWHRTLLNRPGEVLFQQQRKALFEAAVVQSLAWLELNAWEKAQSALAYARAVDPAGSERDPLYLLAAAEIEPDLSKGIRHVEKAAELAPEFQIAKFRLASLSEMLFRYHDELTKDKAVRVLTAYEEVLSLNPGNIAALVAEGHLHWLLKEPQKSIEKFTQGLDLKDIVEETFVGELNYGLARAAAEDEAGCFRCFDFYTQAIAADPGIAAYSPIGGRWPVKEQYEFIGPAMMRRFEEYKDNALKALDKHDAIAGREPGKAETCSLRTRQVVRSFVFNDYGNACFNYRFRSGRESYLRKAIEAYEQAKEADPENAVAKYNLANAYRRKNERTDEVVPLLDDAESLAPTWPAVRSLAAQTALGALQQQIRSLDEELAELAELTTVSQSSRPASAHTQQLKEWGVAPATLQTDDRLSQTTAELEARKQRRTELLEARKAAHAAIQKQVIERLAKAIDETRMGPLLTKAVTWAGGGTNLSVLATIDKERVDEYDLQVILLWAEVMWANTGSTAAWHDARLLSSLHESYYPEDIDRDLLIGDTMKQWQRRTLSKPEKDGNAPDASGSKGPRDPNGDNAWLQTQGAMCPDRVRRVVFRWIHNDPVHSAALSWLHDVGVGVDKAKAEIFSDARRDSAGCWLQLGRLCRIESRWDEAITAFRTAVEKAPDEDTYHYELGTAYLDSHFRTLDETPLDGAIRHFQLAIENSGGKVAEYHAALSRACKEKKLWAATCDAVARALELEPDNRVYKAELALAYNSFGNSLYETRNYAEAAERYQQAVDLDPTDAVFLSNLALALEQDSKNPDTLRRATGALAHALELAPLTPSYELRLARLRALPFVGAEAAARLPAVAPIRLEVAANLIPLVAIDTQLSPLMRDGIDALRATLRDVFGVVLPGVLVRGVEADFPDDMFSAVLMEVPALSGSVSPNDLYVPVPPDVLKSKGLTARPAIDPRSASEASWVDHGDRELLAIMGFRFLGPVEYMLEYLREVLERNLSGFVGVHETRMMIETECADKLADIEVQPGGLVSLSRVLRALLAEQVPITPLRPLVETFLSLSTQATDAPTIVESCRRLPAIRGRLLANHRETALYTLGDDMEARLRASVRTADRIPVLAMPATETQDALTAVRSMVNDERPEAIVVLDSKIRSHVRKLVEMEFPRLRVLAHDELTPELQHRERKTIASRRTRMQS